MAGTAPVTIGLIGCGGNQRNAHIPRLQRCIDAGDALVVAACDPVAANLEAAKEKLPGLSCHATHDELLATESLDAVVISTPHTLHHQHIVDSFTAGCHVLCEKPLVCSVAEAEDVLAGATRRASCCRSAIKPLLRRLPLARVQVLSGAAGPVRYVRRGNARPGEPAGRKGDSWRIARTSAAAATQRQRQPPGHILLW